ncbi:HlyD family secretion protein [Rubripirellula amarantea]|nr:HlyD family efflux transporter periplasmic adaptor subunit [Rubripirellula amarantea]
MKTPQERIDGPSPNHYHPFSNLNASTSRGRMTSGTVALGERSNTSNVPPRSPQRSTGEFAVALNLDDQLYQVLDFDEYTFEIQSETLAKEFDPNASPQTRQGTIVSGNEKVDVQFRPRRVKGDRLTMGFYDFSIQGREQLQRIRKRVGSDGRDELHDMSYDDLAKGGKKEPKAEVALAPKRASTLKKMAAMAVLAASMLLVALWVGYMVQSRSTVAVNNSVMVGNFIPVNAPEQAQLIDVLVETGEEIKAGQTLARLSNREAAEDLAILESQLKRAMSEAEAYRSEAAKVTDLFRFATMKVERDINVAKAEMLSADAMHSAAEAQLARLQPLIARGNVALAEVDEAKAMLATANAEKIRQSAVIETLALAKEAAQSQIIINESGVVNPLSELQTKIACAEAAIKELQETRDVLLASAGPIELQAPSDGTVYAIYRSEGETLRVADQMLALSAEDGGWATGHVAAYLAPEIRPGQPVEIEIPSLGITTVGIVDGVGHRSVYGHGGYNADFRGGPLEVPIRVAIDFEGQPVPSGLRLNMTVRVKDHLKDMKRWINDKIAVWRGETVPGSDDSERQETASLGKKKIQVAMTK